MEVITCTVTSNNVLHLVIQYEDARCGHYVFAKGDLEMYQKIKSHELDWNVVNPEVLDNE